MLGGGALGARVKLRGIFSSRSGHNNDWQTQCGLPMPHEGKFVHGVGKPQAKSTSLNTSDIGAFDRANRSIESGNN
jgi:hypothetical protein